MPIPSPPGRNFRRAVAALLHARYGSENVHEEVELSNGKAADLVFTATDLPGFRPRFAVECKDWSTPLTSRNISNIRSDYAQAVESGDVRGLYIVAPHDIAATVRATAAATYWITFLTLENLQASILDLSSYLRHLIDDFEKDGLSDYYIPSRTGQGTALLHDAVLPWLNSDATQPLAIIAGYGMGKTTYSKYLGSTLAREALADATRPIPIIIPLGEVIQQSNVRSLLSYMFADMFRVPGYTYQLFDALNRQGRFVLIFDAFDEMKYAMSIRDIEHNLEEIKTLIGPLTKAILIGRPDPFLDDDQYALLRGRKEVIGRLAPSARLADFRAIEVAPFSIEDVDLFVERYSAIIQAQAGSLETHVSAQFVLGEMRRLDLGELARRPVQARMITELIVGRRGELEDAGIFALYEHFVMYVLGREARKLARAAVPTERRLSFMRNIAWWLWTKKRERDFSFDEIPARLLDIAEMKHFAREARVRELLVGSVIDRRASLVDAKRGDVFYFAHRSYLEFLVCSFLLEEEVGDPELQSISARITPQLIEFLASASESRFTRLAETISECSIVLDVRLFEFASRAPVAAEYFERRLRIKSSYDAVLSVFATRHNAGEKEYMRWEQYYYDLVFQGLESLAALLFALIWWGAKGGEHRERAMVAATVAGALAVVRLSKRRTKGVAKALHEIGKGDGEEGAVNLFLSCISDVSASGFVFDADLFVDQVAASGLIPITVDYISETRYGEIVVDNADLQPIERYFNYDTDLLDRIAGAVAMGRSAQR